MNLKLRRLFIAVGTVFFFYYLYLYYPHSFSFSSGPIEKPSYEKQGNPSTGENKGKPTENDELILAPDDSLWSRLRIRYPVASIKPLPTERPHTLPSVQTSFSQKPNPERENVRRVRQQAVKDAFVRCWNAYKSRAWMAGEVFPISGEAGNWFGGWGATLVDSLDTLWIMGMHEDFEEAVSAVTQINFEASTLKQVNTFETNIRYLGGLLAGYDLSRDQRLLTKAIQVGNMLYVAFDTPNRMPITRWDFYAAARGEAQIADEGVLVDEIGSFTLEFTRLSQLTGDPKWFDAIQRIVEIFDQQQHRTKLPGMWPVVVNARSGDFTHDTTYTLGAMADSVYEYLPKMHALVGGVLPMYEKMYRDAMDTAIRYNLYRPMIPDEADILISGAARVDTDKKTITLDAQGQHLVCFAGGMLAFGGRLFNNDTHVALGQQLVDGCVWTYRATASGIMPEVFHMVACESTLSCPWDEAKWQKEVLTRANQDGITDAIAFSIQERLPRGFTSMEDRQYLLRPEAIESVFLLYRITGREDLLDIAWEMWDSIQKHTETALANAVLVDVTAPNPANSNRMESFWMGETLKYFYLIFSSPDLISLDEYVFNTEAHPLRRAR